MKKLVLLTALVLCSGSIVANTPDRLYHATRGAAQSVIGRIIGWEEE